MFFSAVGLLVLIVSLALSCLLYLKNIKSKLVPIVNLAMLLVFIYSLVNIITFLGQGISDLGEFSKLIASTLLMNVYAGIVNVATRGWLRGLELLGNKRLKIKIQAEIVEK